MTNKMIRSGTWAVLVAAAFVALWVVATGMAAAELDQALVPVLL